MTPESPDVGEQPQRAITVDDMPSVHRALRDSQLDRQALQTIFRRVCASRDHFIADLMQRHDPKSLSEIARRLGNHDAARLSAAANAEFLFVSELRVFALDDREFDDVTEDFERRISDAIEHWTDEDIRARVAWLTCSNVHRWPANRLTVEDIRCLHDLSNRTGRPMNQLIKEAVTQYVMAQLPEDAASRLTVESFLDCLGPDYSDRERAARFEEWVRTVRDPAAAASEGVRRVEAGNGHAFAEYEVAPLSDGRWALRMRCSYHVGTMAGVGSPWRAFASRDDCVAAFAEQATQFFTQELTASNVTGSQHTARRRMLDLFQGGLFGFTEPAAQPE